VGNLEAMKCIWCDRETTTNKDLVTDQLVYADKEHIFPECVGGKQKFEKGEVCQECNHRLGNEIDTFLQDNFMLIKQFQDTSLIIGKPSGKIRNKEDRKRKEAEMYDKKTPSGTRIKRNPEFTNFITFTNLIDGSSGDYSYNDKFSKALHKCVVNVLLDFKGYDYVKKNYPELIDFVNSKNNHSYHNWSYGICYGDMFAQIHFEPFCLQYVETFVNNETVIGAVVLIFPSAIFVLCPIPGIVDRFLLEKVGSNPPNLRNWDEAKFDYIRHFQLGFTSPRKTYGEKIKFTLVKKEIEGKPNPEDAFYLLTECKTCGQTNPTGIMIGKQSILGKINGLSSGNKNTWNYHSRKDLELLCPGVHFEESVVKDFESKYGINYPSESDVRNLNINNCKCQCFNCGFEIIYDAKDCFI
jgi:signal peptidase I